MNATNENSIQCSLLNAKHVLVFVNPPRSIYINKLIASIFSMMLIIPTVVLNGGSLLTILNCSHLKEKIAYNLIMLQSLADLVVGLVGMPALGYILIPKTTYHSEHCMEQLLLLRVIIFPKLLSLLTLTAMTVERYLGVLHPLKHRTLVTKRRVMVSVLYGGGFLLAGFILLSLLNINMLSRFVAVSLVGFLILSVFVYTKIFITIRKREVPGKVENSATSTITQRTFLKEVKLAKSCFLVLVCFLVCFLTGVIVPFAFNKGDFRFQILRPWAVMLMDLNAIVNSIIFFWKRPQLRKEAMKVVKRFCKC